MLDGSEDILLVDVLPRTSFDKKRIPGSVHASTYDDDFLERVGAIVGDRQSSLVVYCNSRSCNASAKAARRLADAGYTDVVVFEGGVREWEEAGFPVEGSAA